MLHCRYILQEVGLVISDTALSVSYQNKTITLSFGKEEVIKSPGYPHKNYPRNTNYTWYVIASDDTEEISINITTDIHEALGFRCDDYLKVCLLWWLNFTRNSQQRTNFKKSCLCDDYKKVCTLTLDIPGNIFFKKVNVCNKHIHMNVAVIFNLKRFVLDMCHVMKFILRYSFYILDKVN